MHKCTGVLGRNCVAAAFAFSLVVLILGFIGLILVLLYLKPAAKSYNLPQQEGQQEKPAHAEELKEKQESGGDTGDGSESDDEDPEQRHKGVGKQ